MAETVTEDEVRVAVNLIHARPLDQLPLPFIQQCLFHLVQHGDGAASGRGFRGSYVHLARGICAIGFPVYPIDQIVVDADCSIGKVAVFPAQAYNLTDTASRPQKDREQRQPVPV